MELFTYNLKWMIFNCFLAAVPVFLAILVFKKPFNLIRKVGAVIWLLFLPNSIYLVTDIINLLYDVKHISGIYLIADAAMYIVLIPIGIITYILSVRPFEKMFPRFPMWLLSLSVGFGLILGRVQRANSWEIVTEPQNVINKAIDMLRSHDLILLVFIFTVLSQFLYFYYKEKVIRTFAS